MDREEHKLRVYNRENVPTIPELIIPTFMIKKDSMAKNILAYLVNYFIQLFRKITLQFIDNRIIMNIQNVYKTFQKMMKMLKISKINNEIRFDLICYKYEFL